MEYRILGPLEVQEDGESLELGGAKQRALLALLLLNANRAVSREDLIDGLWGDDPPDRAVATVQVYVSRLRKLLPADTLVTSSPGYLLRVEQGELDLERFERLVAEAKTLDPERASGVLARALSLWRGTALAEFAGEPFARVESGRFEDLRLVAVEELIDADLALGRHVELVSELERLITRHPYRGRFQAQLMLALYRSDREAEALAVYADARAALAQLGLEPSAALRQLERQILRHDPALDLGPRRLLREERIPLPGLLVPDSPFPFVGRASEMETLRSLLERGQGGEGGLVLLTGEPGAGKTRLVREFAHEAAGRGALVLYGVSDAAVVTPYQPLREWLEFLLRVCEPEALVAGLGAEGSRLMRLVPELTTLSIRGAASDAADGDRYLLQSAATTLLTRLSRVQPLLLVLDDLHWADAETMELLRRLARLAPESRLLVVAAYRDPGEEITPQLAECLAHLTRLDAVSRLTLGGLSADEVGELVRASADADASPELTAAIGELTDGAPLLVCELWRDLYRSGGVALSEDGVRLSRPAAELRGPERIGEVVRHRLSRLSPETSQTVEVAAVIGPRFELRLVAAAVGLDQAAVVDAVEQASHHGIIEELPDAAPTCRFTHELLRRAVYDQIPRTRLPRLHLSVGEALEELYASDGARVLPELAHHFTLAAPVGGVEHAVEYNVRAAEAALASAAHSEAAVWFSTALELGVDDPRERVRLQIELGNALYDTGRIAESEALFANARDTATGIAARGLAERASVHLATARLNADPGIGSAGLVRVAERAIETFEALGDTLGLAEAEYLLFDALRRDGRRAECDAALERSLVHAQAAGATGLRREILVRLGVGLCESPTPVDEVINRMEELVASSHDDRVLEAALFTCQSYALAMAGRFDEARARLRLSIPVLDQARVTRDFTRGLRGETVAEAHLLMGEEADAERETLAIHQAFRDARGDAPEGRAMQFGARLALLYCDQGRWHEAADFLAYGQEVDRSPPAYGKVYVYLRLAARARVAAHQGDLSAARELGRAAVEVADRTDRSNDRARIWLALGEVQRAAGNEADADAAVRRALDLYERKGNVAALARVHERLLTPTIPEA